MTNAAIGGSYIDYWQHCWPLHTPATASIVLIEVLRGGTFVALERTVRASGGGKVAAYFGDWRLVVKYPDHENV